MHALPSRWLLEHDQQFVLCPGLAQRLRRSGSLWHDGWLAVFDRAAPQAAEGRRAAVQLAAALQQLYTQGMELGAGFVQPGCWDLDGLAHFMRRVMDQLLLPADGLAAARADGSLQQLLSATSALLKGEQERRQEKQQQQQAVGEGPCRQQAAACQVAWQRNLLQALLGIRAAVLERGDWIRHGVFIRLEDSGLQRLWGLLYGISATTTAAELQVDATAAQVLALMVGLGITAIPAAGVACAASRTVVGLARLLKHLLANQQQAPAAALAPAAGSSSPAPGASISTAAAEQQQRQQADAAEGDSGSPAPACTTGFVVSCLAALVQSNQLLQLAALENVHTLPAASSMLAQLHLQGAGLQLLQALASSLPAAQALVVGWAGLLAALVRLLGPAGDTLQRVAALQVLRTLVLGNAAAQLALAQLPGAAAALVALLGGEEGEVANEAAETLAALQHDSEEARGLVQAAGRRVELRLE
jgi:hypothetical protein